jgi:hypothetical protein
MNKIADKDASLFQMCITLRQRLLAVPGFDEYFLETEQQHDDLDVVQLIWKTFQLGYPLVSLYNILRPDRLRLTCLKLALPNREKPSVQVSCVVASTVSTFQ